MALRYVVSGFGRTLSRIVSVMWSRARFAAFLYVALVMSALPHAQARFDTGQNAVPVYEGWEHNADGSFTMLFGYMNRNYEEELDVPVGPDNKFEPRAADEGQPTHFYTRRQQFMLRVRVPKDWGNKDLIWTLTSHGKTEKAYGSLWPVWEIDRRVYQQNRGGPGELGEPDEPPTIKLIGAAQRTVAPNQPLALAAEVTDDGLPTPRATRSGTGGAGGGAAAGRGAAAPTVPGAGRAAAPPSVVPRSQNPVIQAMVKLDPGMRLGVIWVVHRRSVPADVIFEPAKAAVVDGKAATSVRFSQPGTYVLRGYADDGILLDYADVTVTVR